jgi:endo-1,4-beta-xylanase
MKKNPYSIIRLIKENFFSFAFILLLFSWGCDLKVDAKKDSSPECSPDSIKGLKDYYKDFFPVGVAVSPDSLVGSQSLLVLKHFQSLTAENVMKPAVIHPEEDRYSWEDADKIADYASINKMLIRGHVLCWHQQTGE